MADGEPLAVISVKAYCRPPCVELRPEDWEGDTEHAMVMGDRSDHDAVDAQLAEDHVREQGLRVAVTFAPGRDERRGEEAEGSFAGIS